MPMYLASREVCFVVQADDREDAAEMAKEAGAEVLHGIANDCPDEGWEIGPEVQFDPDQRGDFEAHIEREFQRIDKERSESN